MRPTAWSEYTSLQIQVQDNTDSPEKVGLGIELEVCPINVKVKLWCSGVGHADVEDQVLGILAQVKRRSYHDEYWCSADLWTETSSASLCGLPGCGVWTTARPTAARHLVVESIKRYGARSRLRNRMWHTCDCVWAVNKACEKSHQLVRDCKKGTKGVFTLASIHLLHRPFRPLLFRKIFRPNCTRKSGHLRRSYL